MYLWAHHLSDVAAGCLIGALSTVGLSVAFGVHSFGLRHLAAPGLLLIIEPVLRAANDFRTAVKLLDSRCKRICAATGAWVLVGVTAYMVSMVVPSN